MRIVLPLVLALSVAACGDPGSGGPSPRPSELRAAVERLAPYVAFQAFVPDESPPGVLDRVSLYAFQRPNQPDRDVLGEPILSAEYVLAPGAKTTVYLIEGPADCCADMFRGSDRTAAVVRPASGDHPEVGGELVRPRGAAEGPSLWWHEPASGQRTFVALRATSFAQLDEQGLLAIARSMRAVSKQSRGDALLLYLSTHVSHSPSGHRVYIAAKTLPLPDEARLSDANGNVIATASFQAPEAYGCLKAAEGVAALAVPHDVVEKFGQTVGAGYRVEVRVGNTWRQVQLVASGCFSTE
jgi:hypothetical protein